MEQDSVLRAFGVVIDHIQARIDDLNARGASAFQDSQYEKVDQFRQLAEQVAEFRDRVSHVKSEWVSGRG